MCLKVKLSEWNGYAYVFWGWDKINGRGMHMYFEVDIHLMEEACTCVLRLI